MSGNSPQKIAFNMAGSSSVHGKKQMLHLHFPSHSAAWFIANPLAHITPKYIYIYIYMYIIRSVNNMSQPRETSTASTAQRFFLTFMARIPHPIGGGQCIGRRHWERTVAEEVPQRLRGAARGTVRRCHAAFVVH